MKKRKVLTEFGWEWVEVKEGPREPAKPVIPAESPSGLESELGKPAEQEELPTEVPVVSQEVPVPAEAQDEAAAGEEPAEESSQEESASEEDPTESSESPVDTEGGDTNESEENDSTERRLQPFSGKGLDSALPVDVCSFSCPSP